jgi:hypothetical protein
MKEEFIKRQSKRADNIEDLINKYGSIDKIPIAEKDKILKEAKKDLPMINSIHITLLQKELRYRKYEIAILELVVALLSIAFLLHVIIK